jgi:hypothetical protein
LHSQLRIVLAGAPRTVDTHWHDEVPRRETDDQRRVRIDFEVPSCDHAALGRELHLALDGAPLRDQHGTSWQAVMMSSALGVELDRRRFTVELVEI